MTGGVLPVLLGSTLRASPDRRLMRLVADEPHVLLKDDAVFVLCADARKQPGS